MQELYLSKSWEDLLSDVSHCQVGDVCRLKANLLGRPDTIDTMDTALSWSYQMILLDTVLFIYFFSAFTIDHTGQSYDLATIAHEDGHRNKPWSSRCWFIASGGQNICSDGWYLRCKVAARKPRFWSNPNEIMHIWLLISPLNCFWEGLRVWPVLQWGSVQSVFLPLNWPQLGLMRSPWPWLGLSSQGENG